nr:immunoglobulin light chain junction region [Macaca mulatta]
DFYCQVLDSSNSHPVF